MQAMKERDGAYVLSRKGDRWMMPTLAENAVGGNLVVDREKQGAGVAPSLVDRGGHPRIKNCHRRAHVLFCRLLLIWAQVHGE